jgi:hypothetical protein
MGSHAAPHFPICCVVSEATLTARMFSGDAHRESGVISFSSALSPVESCSPPEPDELMALIYSCAELLASEDIVKCNDESQRKLCVLVT